MAQRANWILAGLLALPFVAGVAILALGPAPAAYAISLIAFPLGAFVAGVALARRGARAAAAHWSLCLLLGLGAGLVATLAYDVYRFVASHTFAVAFDPFRVQPVFGQILTGLPTTHPWALLAGWSYHLWLGALLGMILAAVRPRGGALEGALYVVALQLGRWAMYPSVLQAGTNDQEFFANGIVGQMFWGLVLGLALSALHRWAFRNSIS